MIKIMKQHTHVGVYALARKDDAVLLIKKARGPYIGKWDLPGGRLEFGEKPVEGLAREVLEETGLVVQASNLVDVFSHSVVYQPAGVEQEEMYHVGIIYEVSLDYSENLKTGSDGEDSSGASWIKLSEITENNSSPFVSRSIKKFI